jgi:hypothetical protein
MRSKRGIVMTAIVALIFAGAYSARAQTAVTTDDIQRLQDNLYDATRDVTELRSRDAALATGLQAELDALRDETTYLRVKLQRNETVTRGDYSDLRARIEDVRARARGEGGGRVTPSTGGGGSISGNGRLSAEYDVPPGTEVDVRLQQPLSSRNAQPEDRFEATTAVDVENDGRTLIPAGSTVRGVVQAVNKAGRVDRKGSLDLAFDQITMLGRTFPLRATVTQALESEGIRGETGKIGIGAGIGAILGGILGGVRGALAGIVIGGGGVVAATEGKDVELPAGTILRIRLDTGLNLDLN